MEVQLTSRSRGPVPIAPSWKSSTHRGGVGTTTVLVTAQNPNEVPPLPPSNLSVSVYFRDPGRFALDRQLEQTNPASSPSDAWNSSLVQPQPFVLRGASRHWPECDRCRGLGINGGDDVYAWRVKAFDGVGSSAYSNTAEATTPVPPPAPTNLTAKVKGTKLQVNLAWRDNATTETGYTVQRCTGSGMQRTLNRSPSCRRTT